LRPFAGRFELQEVAVGLSDGEVQFGWEDSGRYGGVGMQTGRYVTVRCIDSNRALQNILAAHGHIDILKIDIENLEREVTERIPRDFAEKIDKIYVEYKFSSNPLQLTHSLTHYGPIARFVNKRRQAKSD
jgi:FkbM family methyltransferase